MRVVAPAARCVVLTAQLHDPDAKLMPVLLAADALRRSGVEKLVLLAPYLPYMRQDVAFHAGEALAQRVFAETLGRSLDELVTLEPHLHRIRELDEVFPCRTRSLPAAPLLADWCRKRGGRPLLVGPDAESEPWVRGVARRAGLPWLTGRKRRLSDRRVRIELPEHAPARRAILIDDIASSGATLAAAARALRRAGVERIEAAVAHAVFAPGAMGRIGNAGVSRIVSCDTIPHATNSIGTAAYFAEALWGAGSGPGARDRRRPVFRLKRSGIDTHSEHVIFIHEEASGKGTIGLKPLDRVKVEGRNEATGEYRTIQGILNFCSNGVADENSLALSESAFVDLALPEGSSVRAKLAAPPESISRVREKLAGARFDRSDFDAILIDVTQRRYSKVELSMFVLACALRRLDMQELVDFTHAMISHGDRLDFGLGPIADKHCIGGIPGNRTTMVVVPIVAALGVMIPKTSSRAITSPAGTADTMGVLAEVRLGRERMYEVVRQVGGCIAWGGALDLAPADDVLITVERPMGIDTEAQMIASILSKKKAAGATHALIDIPVGPTAKVRTRAAAGSLGTRFQTVAEAIGLNVDIVVTEVDGPVGVGVGPRLEALDVLSVLN